MATKTWSDFPVKYPLPKKGFDNGCLEIEEVTHVAHVVDAVRVIEDRRIRSALVYDESCLNTKRTQVSWVSPKTWAHGYIYGNVAFAFDWPSLIDGKQIYWVEHRETKGQDICRFLITEEAFTDHPLTEYDYTKPHGPLYLDEKSGKWYHNNKVTSEYMILSDLDLAKCKAIRFERHHSRYCNKSGSACRDRDRSQLDAGAEVIGKLTGARLDHVSSLFEWTHSAGDIDPSVEIAVDELYRRVVERFDTSRTGKSGMTDRVVVMRAIVAACGLGQEDLVSALLAQFPSKTAVKDTFWACLDEYFDGLKVRRR